MSRPDDIPPEVWETTSTFKLQQVSRALDDLWAVIKSAIVR